MPYLADRIFYDDFNIYLVVLFLLIGFLTGFFLKLNSKKRRSNVAKLEKETELNEARIAELKEKLASLEKQNKTQSNTGDGR